MKSCQARVLFAQAGAALAVAALLGGCGDNYRPVVTPIGTNGPPAQVSSYALVISSTGSTTPGVVTIIDYSGDSILNETPIGPGPKVFTIDASGSTGYTVNSDGTLSNFCNQLKLAGQAGLGIHAATHGAAGEPVGAFIRTLGDGPERRCSRCLFRFACGFQTCYSGGHNGKSSHDARLPYRNRN